MERLGLVGLPNSGKSSLYNALTGGSAAVASHPFSTTETSVGVAKVPDHRLVTLAELSRSRKVVEATVEVTDIAGLVAGAASGEGLGNRFLAGIRELDAIAYVLRAFADPGVPGDDDPEADLAVLELELVLADLASAEAQLEKRRKMARQDRSQQAAVDVLAAAVAVLADGTPIYRSSLSAEQRRDLLPMFLLTNKPVIAVVNLGEEAAGDAEATEQACKPVAASLGEDVAVLGVSVKLEAEAARLDAEDRRELLEGLGLGEGALPRVAAGAYQMLGRRTFLTTGEDESRAWTFRAGARAPECAGVIHSDLQRGFIKAEVIYWEELVELGSWAAARDAGRLRMEGKEYEVRDGDVVEIRFNV